MDEGKRRVAGDHVWWHVALILAIGQLTGSHAGAAEPRVFGEMNSPTMAPVVGAGLDNDWLDWSAAADSLAPIVSPRPVEYWVSDWRGDHMTLGEVADDPFAVWPAQGQLFQPALRPEITFQRPVASPAGTRTPSLLASAARFSGLSGQENLLSAGRRQQTTGRVVDVLSGLEAALRATTDAGDLPAKSPAGIAVETQKRTPIVTETRVRGSRTGQLAASGSYWVPARMDLDTALSKIDSRIIEDMIIIKGPYSSLYGPGFDFIDVQLLQAPRYESGFELHGTTATDYKVNGEQWYGRQTFWGGDQDWGVRVGYGHRTGNDYTTGDGVGIPASYNSRDIDVALDADLLPDHHVEFSYIRLDQTGVEYPGQAFDMDFLVTDAFEVEYLWEDQPWFDSLTVDAWYNRTRFEGNSQAAGKRRQFPVFDDILFEGFTDVDSMSTGFRAYASWEGDASQELRAGADLRYLKQQLNEITSGLIGFTLWDQANSPIPKSHWSNPGLFIDYVQPIHNRLLVSAGSRVDWVSANIDEDPAALTDVTTDPRPYAEVVGTSDFDRDFTLASAFVSGEFELCPSWKTTVAGGYAQRAPTLTELYAAEPFMFLVQNGLNSVLGDPTLRKSRLWQFDVALRYDRDSLRASASGFHAWIHDYITLANMGEVNTPPLNLVEQVQLQFVNTGMATVAGFELQGEYDLNAWWNLFGSMRYVEGRDHDRQETLPSFEPLDSRTGVRLHHPTAQPEWGVELAVRMVDGKDRIASSLRESTTPGFSVWELTSYWQVRENLLLIAGIQNIGDRNYREYLDFRPINAGALSVFQPGVNFYFGSELRY